jgi:hypothetical protein
LGHFCFETKLSSNPNLNGDRDGEVHDAGMKEEACPNAVKLK